MPHKLIRPYEWNADIINDGTFIDYFNRLREICMNMFEWKNLPPTVDERWIEKTLMEQGYAIYFNDEIVGNLCMKGVIGGKLDVYNIPTYRRAFASNGYSKQLNPSNSVIIWNNYIHEPTIRGIILYARRLYEIERAIDVNVKAQKTPLIIKCEEKQLLTLKNLYKQYDGNIPVIFGNNGLNVSSLETVNTTAPYVAKDLEELKRHIWNEALTYLGVENTQNQKSERLVSAEVSANQGGVEAERYTRLNSRRQAVEKINAMFGTNIEVNFRGEGGVLSIGDTTDKNFEQELEIKEVMGNG